MPERTERELDGAYGKLPLAFIPNRGQIKRPVRYDAQGAGFGFYFKDKEALLSFGDGKRGTALALRFQGANPNTRLEADRRLEGKVNYLKGADSSDWKTGIPTYGALTYRELWPGVDMVFRGRGGRLKYEFLVRPGAKVSDIRLAYRGASHLSVGGTGALLIGTPQGVLRDAAPRSYQRIGGRTVPVESRFALRGRASYGFELGSGHDPRYPLVIDPGLAYSTYLGGAGLDQAFGIALDGGGSAYVTGTTTSADFPTTAGAYDPTLAGQDAFVTKLNAAGTGLVYSTYLGGAGGTASGQGIALDGGNAYVTGSTNSASFPTTSGAYDQSYNGSYDAFVTKLNAAGTGLVYSSYLGGASSEGGQGIAVDGGNAYMTGDTTSASFPTTSGAYDETFSGIGDAFVTKLNAAGSALVYSTYLGGTSGTAGEAGHGIAVDGGNAYLTGSTTDASFPTTSGAYDETFNGVVDAFVTKLNAAGSALVYSTFLGSPSDDQGRGIAVDGGNAYLTGTAGAASFPTTSGAYDETFNGAGDAFVTKLNAAGSALVYSTYLGGAADDFGFGVAVNGGRAYLTGLTDSANFPTTPGSHDATLGIRDAYVTNLSAAGTTVLYSTYLGGTFSETGYAIAVDNVGNPYVAGDTNSSDFPTTPGAFDGTLGGGFRDAFVTKLDPVPYPHFASASPIDVSLVPVFRQCGTGANPGNGEHAPPLAVDACVPPASTSSLRAGATGAASIRFEVTGGDVAITASATDIRTSSGAAHTGTLGAAARMRFSDLRNCAPSGCSGPYEREGTAVDLDFGPVAFPCSSGACALSTTANAFMPGSVVAGKATNIQVFRARVFDGYPSGMLFLQQGLFVP